MQTLEQKNQILKQLGVDPRGLSGCNTCDVVGYLVCRCMKAKGNSGGGGSSKGPVKVNLSNHNSNEKKLTSLAAQHKSSNHQSSIAIYQKIYRPFTMTLGLPLFILNQLSNTEKEELLQLLAILQTEFMHFVQTLEKNGVSIQNYLANIKDHTLVLTIPNANHYDGFIKQLIQKNYLTPNGIVATPDLASSTIEQAALQEMAALKDKEWVNGKLISSPDSTPKHKSPTPLGLATRLLPKNWISSS